MALQFGVRRNFPLRLAHTQHNFFPSINHHLNIKTFPILTHRANTSTLSTRSESTLRPNQPFNTTINPPESTRPPPLKLPSRSAFPSRFSYLYALAKAYISFYLTALRGIRTNRKLSRAIKARVRDESAKVSAGIDAGAYDLEQLRQLGLRGPTVTRAEWQLLRRSGLELRRLPLFLVMFVCTGEFFPLVVYALRRQLSPALPVPVLLPDQERFLRERAFAFASEAMKKWEGVEIDKLEPVDHVRYMADYYGCHSRWLPYGWTPMFVLGARVMRRVNYLRYDDQLLGKNSIQGLVDEEVVLAATERGIWDPEADMTALRARLQKRVNVSFELEQKFESKGHNQNAE